MVSVPFDDLLKNNHLIMLWSLMSCFIFGIYKHVGAFRTESPRAASQFGVQGGCRFIANSVPFLMEVALISPTVLAGEKGEGEVNRPRPFICTYEGCGKRFAHLSTITTHERTHTGDRPFACTFEGCGKCFSESGHLTTHTRTHTGDQPFACDYDGCGKRFSHSGALNRHKRTHTGLKPFVCDHEGCGKRFSESGHLTTHRRTHMGERPFACEFEPCDKRFSQSSSLKRHMRICAHGLCTHKALSQLCEEPECVQRRELRRQLDAFSQQDPSSRPATAVPSAKASLSLGKGTKHPRGIIVDEKDWYEREGGMLLTQTLFDAVDEAGLPLVGGEKRSRPGSSQSGSTGAPNLANSESKLITYLMGEVRAAEASYGASPCELIEEEQERENGVRSPSLVSPVHSRHQDEDEDEDADDHHTEGLIAVLRATAKALSEAQDDDEDDDDDVSDMASYLNSMTSTGSDDTMASYMNSMEL